MVRTRSGAATLIAAGHVRLNGARLTAPGHLLRAGDVLTVALDRTVRVVRVERFSERRGGPADARGLYTDLGAPRRA